MNPRKRELCNIGQAEVISKSRSNDLQTWGGLTLWRTLYLKRTFIYKALTKINKGLLEFADKGDVFVDVMTVRFPSEWMRRTAATPSSLL